MQVRRDGRVRCAELHRVRELPDQEEPATPRMGLSVNTSRARRHSGARDVHDAHAAAARSLHAAWPSQGERPMAALLLGAPHRKADACGICRVKPELGALRGVAYDAITTTGPRKNHPTRRDTCPRVKAARRAAFTHRALRLFLQPQRWFLLRARDVERCANGGSARQQQAS